MATSGDNALGPVRRPGAQQPVHRPHLRLVRLPVRPGAAQTPAGPAQYSERAPGAGPAQRRGGGACPAQEQWHRRFGVTLAVRCAGPINLKVPGECAEMIVTLTGVVWPVPLKRTCGATSAMPQRRGLHPGSMVSRTPCNTSSLFGSSDSTRTFTSLPCGTRSPVERTCVSKSAAARHGSTTTCAPRTSGRTHRRSQ